MVLLIVSVTFVVWLTVEETSTIDLTSTSNEADADDSSSSLFSNSMDSFEIVTVCQAFCVVV